MNYDDELFNQVGVLRRHIDIVAVQILNERILQMDRYPESEHLPDGTGGGGRRTWEAIAKGSCERAEREGRLTFAHIFDEETAEVLAEEDPIKLRAELIQVMAVAAKWIADIDGRAKP